MLRTGSPSLLSLFFLGLLSSSVAQTAPGETSQSSTVLRTTTRLVLLNVVAVDERGAPVLDLKEEDFTVLEDGKPQKISSFRLLQPVKTVQTAKSLPPGTVTNAPQYSGSSLNVILLDTANAEFTSHVYAQDMLIKYLASNPAIQPTAVYGVKGKLILLQDFTTDTKLLRDAVAKFKPPTPDHIPTVEAAATPFGYSGSFHSLPRGISFGLNALTSLTATLAGYPGRKNVIWLSEGFPVNLFPPDGGGDTITFSLVLEKLVNDLMNAQIALYPIDAAGLSINDRFDYRTNMLSMSSRTGGKTFYNRNDIDMGIRSSLDDGATYYTVEYYPLNRVWDNRFRHIEIKLARSGVHLRYRQGYYAQQPTAQDQNELAKTFIRSLAPNGPASIEVLFQATVVPPSAATGGKPVVNFAIDPRTLALQRGPDDLYHGQVTCAAWAYPEKGPALPSQRDAIPAQKSLDVALKEDAYQQVMNSSLPCAQELDLKPGKYTLRLGVVDQTTRLIGTTSTQLTVP